MLRVYSTYLSAGVVTTTTSSFECGFMNVSIIHTNHQQKRRITTSGQFNPIHDFSLKSNSSQEADKKDTSNQLARFVKRITNPGPLRITYSSDYLDWYFRAYNAKLKYDREKAIVEAKQLSKGSGVDSVFGSAFLGLSEKCLRPKGSRVRHIGECTKRDSQQTIMACSIQHGMWDVLERQSQYPSIHIDNCTDEHIKMIYKELIEPYAVTALEIWEKALMYRALLAERRTSYPDSFAYIQDAVSSVTYASKADEDPQDRDSSGPRYKDADVYPTEEAGNYYKYLCKKYHIENGVEAAVVLRTHRHPDAGRLLYSNPAPKAEAEEFKAPCPTEFPPLSALLEEGNTNLLRCLIFAEFNTIVSCDPFTKYPESYNHIMKTRSGERSMLGSQVPSEMLASTRGPYTAPFPKNVAAIIDGRGKDVHRMQQSKNNIQDEHYFNRELPRLADQNPALYVGDSTVYNPRRIRAEFRDINSREMLGALKKYDAAEKELTHRHTQDSMDNKRHNRRSGGQWYDGFHEQTHYTPSVVRFVSLLMRDKHLSFLANAATGDASDGSSIRVAVSDLAEVMYGLSREYHLEKERRLHYHKYQIAASILDDKVKEVVDKMLRLNSSTSDITVAGTMISSTVWRSLGSYTPYASRALDEMGFLSEAKTNDYERWMKGYSVEQSIK
eukprot:Tbor_TRINITY_DN112_c0_g1::TRINITY_DN112_c0_g1_i1::g.12026::m.12026